MSDAATAKSRIIAKLVADKVITLGAEEGAIAHALDVYVLAAQPEFEAKFNELSKAYDALKTENEALKKAATPVVPAPAPTPKVVPNAV